MCGRFKEKAVGGALHELTQLRRSELPTGAARLRLHCCSLPGLLGGSSAWLSHSAVLMTASAQRLSGSAPRLQTFPYTCAGTRVRCCHLRSGPCSCPPESPGWCAARRAPCDRTRGLSSNLWTLSRHCAFCNSPGRAATVHAC